MIEGCLHGLKWRLHPTQGPGVAVAQRVQRPLQLNPGQHGRLPELLADVLAIDRLVGPAAGEDGVIRTPRKTGKRRPSLRSWQRIRQTMGITEPLPEEVWRRQPRDSGRGRLSLSFEPQLPGQRCWP